VVVLKVNRRQTRPRAQTHPRQSRSACSSRAPRPCGGTKGEPTAAAARSPPAASSSAASARSPACASVGRRVGSACADIRGRAVIRHCSFLWR
jgi:hypothetical protein